MKYGYELEIRGYVEVFLVFTRPIGYYQVVIIFILPIWDRRQTQKLNGYTCIVFDDSRTSVPLSEELS